MGLPGWPKSIRGKLILVFLIAVIPTLCVQFVHEIGEYGDAKMKGVTYQRALASAVAEFVSRQAARLKSEREKQAEGRRAGKLVTNVDGAEIMSRIPLARNTPGWCCCALVGSRGSLVISPRSRRARWNSELTLSSLASAKSSDGMKTVMCPSCGRRCAGAAAGVSGTQWNVLVLDTSHANLAAAARERGWLAASIVAAGLGLAIIFTMGNRLAHPIRRLALAASAIAVGDYRKRVKIATGDELETLGESFNSLGKSLVGHEATVRGQAEMLAGMVEAAQIASSSLDIHKCGKAIAKVLCSHLGASDAVVFRKDITNGVMQTIGRSGKPHAARWKRLAWRAAESGGYLVISELQPPGAQPQAGAPSLVGMPLSTGAGSLGAIVARFDGDVVREDLRLGSIRADVLAAFGIHAAAAIRNAEVYSQTERYSEILEDWVEHLSCVMQVADTISPSLDLEQTLAALARATASVMNADACVVWLPDRNGNLRIRGQSSPDLDIARMKLRPGESVSGAAFAQKRHVACCDATASDDPATIKLYQAGELRGVLSSPLVAEDRAIGAIEVACREPREFTSQEIRLLSSIGLHTAVLVRNADRYTQEASIAQALQKGLMSEVPDRHMGLSFASRYIPAMDEARLGGDFYDAVELPNGKIGVVIADVSGKGLDAAIHLATCKYMMKGLMYAHPDDPALVLRKLNDSINYYYDLCFFVTVFYGVIDTGEGTMRYANAGHPPALLISQEGKMHTCLAATGIPVGSGYKCEYTTRQIEIGPSDMLLLYTDGAIDAVINGSPQGVEGLQRIVFGAGHCSAPELVDFICDRLISNPAAQQKDDMALLAIAFEGIAATVTDVGGGHVESKHNLAARTG